MCYISLGFISSQTSSDREGFLSFLFKSMRGEMIRSWRGYSCSWKAGKELKSNVSDFFVLKLEVDFWKMIIKKK